MTMKRGLLKGNSIQQAKDLFTFLAEVKKLSSPTIKDCDTYDQVIWVSELPRDKGCYTKAWNLIGQPAEKTSDNWLEIEKPQLDTPPELPDGLELFVKDKEWRDSSFEEPTLKAVSREKLIRHFLPDEDIEPEYQTVSINENEDIFEAYVEYVDGPWMLWAKKCIALAAECVADSAIPDCPSPPVTLLPWLDIDKLKDYKLNEPPLLDEISVEIDNKFDEAKLKLETEWRRYLDKKWNSWAEVDRKQQKIQKIYNQLYSIYQRHQKLGEQYEIVIGFGCLLWKAPKSKFVRRHVLTLEANIDFDPRLGVISVNAPLTGTEYSVEDDMLNTEERPQPSEKAKLDKEAKKVDGDFWDKAILSSLVESFGNSLQYSVNSVIKNDAQFALRLEKPEGSSIRPQLNIAPAVILRKRSQRGFIKLLEDIVTKIEETGVVPSGIEAIICEPKDDSEAEYGASSDRSAFEDQEIYFPLPANKEQRQIANFLNRGKGVRVQGPPGTGKSHSIANLICHLLASGKKVLVTSETERALSSLRAKFVGAAEPLSSLAVILLGNDTASMRELEKSVLAITTKKEHWSKTDSDASIKEYEGLLDKTRKSRRIAENDLREIRELDVHSHKDKFGRYNGSLQEIALQVLLENNSYTWLMDKTEESLNSAALFKNDESEVFVRQWHEWEIESIIDIQPELINLDGFPEVTGFEETVLKYADLKSRVDVLRGQVDEALLEKIEVLDVSDISAIQEDIAPILAGLRNLKQHISSWAYEAGKQIVAEQDRSWRELLKLTTRELDKCEPLLAEVEDIEITGFESTDLKRIRVYVELALEYAAQGKKVTKSLFHPKDLKEALKNLEKITIDGHLVDSPEKLDSLKNWIDINIALNILDKHWSSIAVLPPTSYTMRVAQYRDLVEPLELALNMHPHVQAAQQSIDRLAKFSAPNWHRIDDLERFYRTFENLFILNDLDVVNGQIKEFASSVYSDEEKTPEIVSHILLAIADKNVRGYSAAIDGVKTQNELYLKQHDLVAIARKFRSNLPDTFNAFRTSTDIEEWVAKLKSLDAAVQWAKASSWVEQCSDPKAADIINTNIESLSGQERVLLGKLAEEKAWGYCIERLGEKQRQALVAWLQAIEHIGKGTGRHASHHRNTARLKLIECQSAIPAWVMPLHRVVETVQAQPEIFDVAIIDEASQSGSEALILNYIAKKVIVVGDDKQIRPQHVGINHDDVDFLRKTYLKDIPQSESFDLKSSYFSQAAIRFPNQVSLKEHFRCMPEIIRFSNNYFYHASPLIPLKQFGSDRLEPVLTEYIEDGYKEGTTGKVYNKPEAQRLVERIAECCADPVYEGKTFGVITLNGHQQSALIEELLLNEIDAQEYEDRKLMIGTAYAFQGDERDIIFISMVDAPMDGRRCRMVGSAEKQREFNVAASRAKEQMILFHSATLNDLKMECLQYKLLSHCLNPSVKEPAFNGMSVDRLRELAHSADRMLGNQPDPFDSWFEVDVFLKITNRGYQVFPQYTVNPYDRTYRIDMVVIGMAGMLAVECDGDFWHGPAQYDSDMARQRELERCGWEFFRVRGGAFYRDQDTALDSLWGLLKQREIFPEGYGLQTKNSVVVAPAISSSTSDKTENKTPQCRTESSRAASVSEEKQEEKEPVQKVDKRNLSPAEIQTSILGILSNRPNNSIAVKSITTEVLKAQGIVTRGVPRRELDKKIMRSLSVLKRQKKIEEYKAKNNRVRLKC